MRTTEKKSNGAAPRCQDEAEHDIYKAVQRPIHNGFRAPFIAVHNLNIDHLRHHLDKLFHHIDWKDLMETMKPCFREYDFILIGPSIGIVVIEVKSSPRIDHYYAALKQTESADMFFQLLGRCTGMEMPDEIKIRKVVYTPNMEKINVRQDAGYGLTDEVVQWSKEGLPNSGSAKFWEVIRSFS